MKSKLLITLLLVHSISAQDEVAVETAPEIEPEVTPPETAEETAEIESDTTPVNEDASPPDGAEKIQKVPFTNPVSETIGTILMLILISLSNAGGLSGAGSNIPIMLIFFSLDMSEAVPISAFVAVCATILRFTLNFSQKHPTRPERTAINYEIVQLTMPCVFLGSFLGVMLGKQIGQTAQICIFGVTVAWSIKTTLVKAFQLQAKERESSTKEGESLINNEEDENAAIEATTPEMEAIKYQEKYHFTSQRMTFIFLNFSVLFVTQFLYGQKEDSKLYLGQYKQVLLYAFILFMLCLTYYSVKRIHGLHEIKKRDGYNFDSKDTTFEGISDIFTLAFVCMIAAVLCGCTGIAGGMVLGPLFLKYNMHPSIMSGTNQYITMIASVSVAIQFAWIGDMIYSYAILFGVITIISAYIGITAINYYVKKTGGKQSIIAFMLVLVLVLALVSLPINSILKAQAKSAKV